jgi:hypothetical protein
VEAGVSPADLLATAKLKAKPEWAVIEMQLRIPDLHAPAWITIV